MNWKPSEWTRPAREFPAHLNDLGLRLRDLASEVRGAVAELTGLAPVPRARDSPTSPFSAAIGRQCSRMSRASEQRGLFVPRLTSSRHRLFALGISPGRFGFHNRAVLAHRMAPVLGGYPMFAPQACIAHHGLARLHTAFLTILPRIEGQ